MKLYKFQEKIIDETYGKNRVAYYLDMGLGKTFVGSEKMILLDTPLNLVVCQKSKVRDWIDHFNAYPDIYTIHTHDLTRQDKRDYFLDTACKKPGFGRTVGIINYDRIFRDKRFLEMEGFTLILDESQNIRNENARRSKAILKMQPQNVILLSGTPVSGKYEQLWSQCRLLGWDITKKAFWSTYIETKTYEDMATGFRYPIVTGYKNVDRLKRKLADHGAVFMKTKEVIELPEQRDIFMKIKRSVYYDHFIRNRFCDIPLPEKVRDDLVFYDLMGDSSLTYALYARQLCGHFSEEKIDAFEDLMCSTEKSMVVFYNFHAERDALIKIIESHHRHYSIIDGTRRDLESYNLYDNAITLVQYQAGATGLNLQKSHITVYFTLPFGRGSCGLWEQSRKRTHRIGQRNECLYYYLIVDGSIEEKNYLCLQDGKEYDDALFEKDVSGGG